MRRIGTALVTGASSGIGVEFARQLAQRRCSVVLVARRTERLEQLAAELRSRHGVTCEVIAADLTADDDLARVEERLRDPERPVDLLVNNAGVAFGGPVVKTSAEEHDTLLRLNVRTPVLLARAAAETMAGRGGGAVINVASMAGMIPGAPYSAAYAASKAHLLSFTQALATEARSRGVRVVALCPGYVRTEMTEGVQAAGLPGVVWVPVERVVRESLRALATGRTVVVPGLQYKAVHALAEALPTPVLRALLARTIGRVRNDALGKPQGG
ncbi:SDR family NAD(P)-dependent oxidoreductase [Allostreptomyces psammosilenae]|uniref:Ketoreductase domain-containing protein n=1 Tax=Allostreptomyces psammosilenae TaxID=1892865 RepID=A0A852ZVM4_9ACTN|nr:SDR family NAD(P)-dependent oxidoreductase [Allostreptomyces psammosilenae]NYI04834.1 hypothetical protein [Allostreptomyces psammosilenae]